ncbi:hypothetical protein [uncultured Flavonifractor sp.]|uniref:hypothetical protein n=1 Tax=uncultured Flavonifractor sp. TaxID=1193534 RepID=UPI002597962D|nr:hypothetical protein [uncultured Flavonifractor sp.]
MGTFRCRVAAVPLTALLLFSAVVPVSAAAAAPGTGETSLSAAGPPSTISEATYLVPIDSTQAVVNGEMVLVETYEVPTSMDPNRLIKDGFELRGHFFELDSIVKEECAALEEKDVTMDFSAPVGSGELGDNLGSLPETLEYDKDGWKGTLYPVLSSVQIEVTDKATRSKTNTTTKTFDLGEFNDPTAIPSTYNGMSRSSYEITPSGYIEGSSIPSGYTATATYTSKSYYTVPTAWTMKATYTGVASYDELTNFRYTVTYKGDEIQEGQAVLGNELVTVPRGYTVVGDELVKTGFDFIGFFSSLGGAIFLLVLLALIAGGIVLGVLAGIRRGIFYSRKIIIEAQDDMSGEYSVMQKARVRAKSPAFTLDTLRAPAAKHFRCAMSGGLAKKLRGKIINISADGGVVAKHRVEPLSDKEKYVFAVDLEHVDAGPMDPFSL